MTTCLDVLSPKPVSNCTFHCQRCGAEGDRAESVKLRPLNVPSFIDVCPRCHSYDVEVIAPGWGRSAS
jgi:Zn finger protein HypA/HybF involved in hydrogenase expression